MRRLFFAIVCLLLISNILKAQIYNNCIQECPDGYTRSFYGDHSSVFVIKTENSVASYNVKMDIMKCCKIGLDDCTYLIDITAIEPMTEYSRIFTNSILKEIIIKALGKSREYFGILGNLNLYNLKIKTKSCYPTLLPRDSVCGAGCCISNYYIQNIGNYDVVRQVTNENAGDTCSNENCINACISHNIEFDTKILYIDVYCYNNEQCYWTLWGNSNIENDYNFIGPKNGSDFIIKTGNQANDSLKERVRVTSDGKFSIGVENPLDIFTVGLKKIFNSKISFGNDYDNPSIKFYRAMEKDSCSSDYVAKAFPWRIELVASEENIPMGSLVFKSGNIQCSDGYETISPKMVMTSDGRVGIGKLNPLASLDVDGYIVSNSIVTDNIAIGTDTATALVDINGPTNMINLKVKGIILTEEVRVKPSDDPDWPDNVFDEDYKRMSINQIEDFIKNNKHLPGIPSKKEILLNGVNLNEMQMLLLKKIEELTLEIIDLKKELNLLKNK